MQRLIISLKFVNLKCDNFRFFIVRGKITIVIKKMKAFGKFLAIENQLPDIGFKT